MGLVKKWIEKFQNSSRRDKVFLTALIINLCFVTVFGVQLGDTIAKRLNANMTLLPVTADGAIRSGDPNVSKAAIACNVDWGEAEIPAMLNIFKEKDVKISFFVCGRWAKNNPALLREMYMAGHEIGNHGYGHKLPTKLTMEQNRDEIANAETIIQGVTGIKPTLFAPPSGDYDKNTVALCEDMGYKLMLWTADTVDWKEGSTAKVILQRVLKKDLNGAIILMHPKPETVKALPDLVDEIQKRGIELVTASELIGQ